MEREPSVNDSRLAIDFIDPLFAVAIHISLVEGLGKTAWYEHWHSSDATFPTWHATDWFNVLVLLLAYSILITSWIGYHQSVAPSASPIRLDTTPGKWRFGLDILLLLCYSAMLARFEDLPFVLWTIAVVFVLFFLWDQAKRREYPDKDHGDTARRRGVTTFWAIAYTALAALGTWVWPRSLCIWLVAVVFCFAYRWHKGRPRVPFPKILCWPYSAN